MMRKLVLPLLCLFLLLQQHAMGETYEEKVEERFQVISAIFYDYTDVMYVSVKRLESTVKNVLKELADVKDIKADGDIKTLQNFLNAIEEMEKARTSNYADIFKRLVDHILPEYLRIANAYNGPVSGTQTSEQQLIRNALEKFNHTTNEITTGFYRLFKQKSRRYNELLAEYIAILTPAERRREQKLLDFYNDFNGEINPKTRYDRFLLFTKEEKDNFINLTPVRF